MDCSNRRHAARSGDASELPFRRVRRWDVALEAADALRGRKLGSMLSTLVIALAVLGVLGADLAGQAHSAAIEARLERLRARWLTVMSPAEQFALEGSWDEQLAELPFVRSGGIVWRPDGVSPGPPGQNSIDAPVIAVSPGGMLAMEPSVASGRIFDGGHFSRRDRVAVVGPGLANRLGMAVYPGASLDIGGVPFTVVGILRDVGTHTDALMGVVVPGKTASQWWVPSEDRPAELLVEVRPGSAELAQEALPVHLSPAGASRILISTPLEPDALIDDIGVQLRRLLLVASAVLATLGTGIITAQLSGAVHARRSEIGLRRALGAAGRHVHGQLLIEGGLVALGGSMVGVAAAALVAIGISIVGPWGVAVPGWSGLLVPGSVVVGMAAALVPARRAARIDPVEALRSG